MKVRQSGYFLGNFGFCRNRLLFRIDYPGSNGVSDKTGDIVNIQTGHHLRPMRFDGFDAYMKPSRNPFRGQPSAISCSTCRWRDVSTSAVS